MSTAQLGASSERMRNSSQTFVASSQLLSRANKLCGQPKCACSAKYPAQIVNLLLRARCVRTFRTVRGANDGNYIADDSGVVELSTAQQSEPQY